MDSSLLVVCRLSFLGSSFVRQVAGASFFFATCVYVEFERFSTTFITWYVFSFCFFFHSLHASSSFSSSVSSASSTSSESTGEGSTSLPDFVRLETSVILCTLVFTAFVVSFSRGFIIKMVIIASGVVIFSEFHILIASLQRLFSLAQPFLLCLRKSAIAVKGQEASVREMKNTFL